MQTDEKRKQFETDGFLKLTNVFPRKWIEKLYTSFHIRTNYGSSSPRQTKNLPSQTPSVMPGAQIYRGRFIIPIPLTPPFNQPVLYANPAILPLMKALLGSDCILSSLGVVAALPGATDQHIHSDFEPLFPEQEHLRGNIPSYAITVAVPLIDIDAVNGPTKIWAGTHRVPLADIKKIDECYPRHLLYGEMGSCYCWDYRTLHAGGSNHSEQMRPLLYMSYTRRWFKDFKNPDRLILSKKEYEKVPQEYRSLFPKAVYWTAEQENAFQTKVRDLLQPAIQVSP